MLVVTYADLRAGLQMQTANRAQDAHVLVLLTNQIPVLPFTQADAERFSVLCAVVCNRSRNAMDRLIAAHVLSRG